MRKSNDPPTAQRIYFGDIRAALANGWRDFRTAPAFGLFFAGVYAISGLLMVEFAAGTVVWTLVLSLGFPLAAPFLAVGLYDVSRRLEAGEPLVWRQILGVIWDERRGQVPWMGAIIVIYFLFWTFLAHMLFALFMGPSALSGPPGDLASYMSRTGLAMIVTEMAVGGVLALLLFALTAFGLPMVLDRDVDFVTAMITSYRAVTGNAGVMLVWAAMIAVATLAALVPMFLGLFLVLPVLGHASWHLYRRVIV